MIILDTNVLSELSRQNPAGHVVAWLDRQFEPLFTTAVTISELAFGVVRLPVGRRRANLADDLERVISVAFSNRILPFDSDAAIEYGRLQAGCSARGAPGGVADVQIAAIAVSHGAVVATRDVQGFDHPGLRVVDPWHA